MRNHAGMDDRRKQFGALAREAREAAGFRSRPALAKAAGIGERTVAAVERGEQSGPKARAAVARAVGWNPSDVEAFLEGALDDLPTIHPFATSGPPVMRGWATIQGQPATPQAELPGEQLAPLDEVLTATVAELAKLARLYAWYTAQRENRDPNTADEERFMLWAIDVRKQRRGIKPSGEGKRDVS